MTTLSSQSYLYTNGGHKILIDSEDLERASAHTWYYVKRKSSFKIMATIKKGAAYKTITLERFLITPEEKKIAFALRKSDFDFRKEFIVVCTRKERQRSLPKRKCGCTSRYRGVSYSYKTGKWRAGIQVDSVSYNLGEFYSEVEAALAYNEASKKFFGSFAYQNELDVHRPENQINTSTAA